MTTTLYLVRHGEVEERYHKVFGGDQIDMELSPLGHQQAEALAEYLGRFNFDAIYASPMKRAQQTLAPLSKRFPILTTCLPDLREVNFGDWTGLKWQDVQDRHGVSAYQWLDMIHQGSIPNGECARRFADRVEPCLKAILDKHRGQEVAVVCHGGVVRMLLTLLLELPLPTMARLDIEYASVTIVKVHATKTEIKLLNLTPWRDLHPPKA
ncbi:MAG: phosphoglycerate mutase [Verrucomicrobiales bacterium]|jgi:broad specificity phosphatase PhoE|nr:phosphoglycerate mutase [Verrucomicrobiales bacterium]